MKFAAPFLIAVVASGCSPAQHREPLYGPTPMGVASNDPKEIADQISSVNAQLKGIEAQMATLDGQIAALERTKDSGKELRLSQYLEQRGALESRHSALRTRRTSLQSLRDSHDSRTTVPMQ